MSLTAAERAATRDELRRNLTLAGHSPESVAAALGLADGRAHAALDVTGARPEHVWLVRDYLDREIRAAGGTPQPWSTLTDGARASALRWFPLSDVETVLTRVS